MKEQTLPAPAPGMLLALGARPAWAQGKPRTCLGAKNYILNVTEAICSLASFLPYSWKPFACPNSTPQCSCITALLEIAWFPRWVFSQKGAPEVVDKHANDQASFLEILIQSFWANVCKSVCFICVFLKITFQVIVPLRKFGKSAIESSEIWLALEEKPLQAFASQIFLIPVS